MTIKCFNFICDIFYFPLSIVVFFSLRTLLLYKTLGNEHSCATRLFWSQVPAALEVKADWVYDSRTDKWVHIGQQLKSCKY